jgi:hypothetical protein
VLLVLACGALVAACQAYDSNLLPPPAGPGSGSGGASGMDGSVLGGASGDGGPQEGGSGGCVADAPEACNRNDDDCDGKTDEDVGTACEQTILHGDTVCVPFENTARCLLIDCHAGYDNCDGNPANGCEPMCICNPCDDAGAEDAGE